MQFLAHIFIPRTSNNYRAKLLHPISFFVITAIFFTLYILHVPSEVTKILGLTADKLPAERIIELTNEVRTRRGLAPLKLDETLAKAAHEKGLDMLENDYWAHISSNGTTPWSFFLKANYDYRYAGENLARDFDSPEGVVEAWMESPSHRDNLLSSKYEDIGIAVVQGDLSGSPTTIVVQMLGTRMTGFVHPKIAKAPSGSSLTSATGLEHKSLTQGITAPPFKVQRNLAIGIVGMLFAVLLVDAVVVWNKRIIRISGRSLAHFGFLATIAFFILMAPVGQILKFLESVKN